MDNSRLRTGEGHPPLGLGRGSVQAFDRLVRSLPGGDTRTSTFYLPQPLILARGQGPQVIDIDGNAYFDLVNNFTALIHGHAHAGIVSAIQNQASEGVAFSAPHVAQAALAEQIKSRISSAELVRFTNSGTEAVIVAVRAARAATGRSLVVKAHGGYHGSWEQLPMSRHDSMAGVPKEVQNLLRWCDYNDVEGLRSIMDAEGSDVAAILLEPVMGGGGVITGSPEFLRAARSLATEHGAVLVFDEVMSVRLHVGGYQAVVGVDPDLTTLGKIIGGGLPVGAVGGRREIMEIFDPRIEGHLYHGGTTNGNPLTMVAGCASLDLLPQEEIDRINALSRRLVGRLEDAFSAAGLDITVTSSGSLLHFHHGHREIKTYDDVDTEDPVIGLLHSRAVSHGVFFARRGLANVSTAMTEAIVDEVAARLAEAADDVVQTTHVLSGSETG